MLAASTALPTILSGDFFPPIHVVNCCEASIGHVVLESSGKIASKVGAYSSENLELLEKRFTGELMVNISFHVARVTKIL